MESVKHNDLLAVGFEQNRGHLRAVAYRMLGSMSEAEDAVQEAWVRLNRVDASRVENLGGWLTTVVARVCLDMLRTRTSHRTEPLGDLAEPIVNGNAGANPEQEAILADSVGLALLVVLDRLAPAERLAFVLHDMFAVSFQEIATILGRSPVAARQLASRARRRVQGGERNPKARTFQQQKVVETFLAALRRGDLQGVLAVLDPNVVRRADRAAMPSAESGEIRGAMAVAEEALKHANRVRFARAALVDGSVGIVVAPRGRLVVALKCTVKRARIVEMEVVAESDRLSRLAISSLED